MSIRSFLAPAGVAALLTAALAACAPVPSGGGYGGAPAAFNTEDFVWSSRGGQASINGRIDFRRDGKVFSCTGSIGLTPDTPYTRARFRTLYGSTERAALPEAVVRARTVPDPNADYRDFVRSETCENGQFHFNGLPDGGWFVIAPVTADGEERTILMRRVETRGGRAINVVL